MLFPIAAAKPVEIPKSSARPQRLLILESLLRGSSAWGGKQLAELFGVGLRTILRDIRLLRQSDIPVVFDPIRDGYCIMRDEATASLAIEVAELVALVLAVKHISTLPECFAEPCDSAISKVLQAVTPPVRRQALAILELYPREFDSHPRTLELPQRQLG
jgi:predicted DNA-binding transcriptional regulator YafY